MKNKKILICLTLVLISIFFLTLSACNLFYHMPGMKHENADYQYTVTFQTNGGTVVASYTGTVLESSPQTTKEGSSFKGWYLTPDFLGNAVIFPFTITENCTLYAMWQEEGTDGLFFSFNSESETYIVTGYDGISDTVIIPDKKNNYSVTGIGSGAFTNNITIKNISLQEGIQSIGNYAFSGCSQLSVVDLNEGLKSIGDYAFKDCVSIRNLEIPISVESIGLGALSGVYNLSSLFLSFSGAKKVPEKNEEKLFGYIFGKDSYKNSVATTQVINEIEYLFYIPGELKNITVYSGDIFESSFYGLSGVKNFIIEGATKICDYAFSHTSGIESVSLSTVVEIGNSAFEDSEIATIKNGDKISVLGNNAFKNCVNLTAINFPSLTKIGSYAFSGMTGTSGTYLLGDGVSQIGEGVFENCTFPVEWNSTLTVLGKALIKYKGENFSVPAQIESLSEGEFEECSAIIDFSLNSKITSFPKDSFKNYKGATLTVPKNVITITNAFSGAECDIDFEQNRTASQGLIGQGAFENGGSQNGEFTVTFNSEMDLNLGANAFKNSFFRIVWGGAEIISVGSNCFNGYKADTLVFDKGFNIINSAFYGYTGNLDLNNYDDNDSYTMSFGAFNGYGNDEIQLILDFRAQFAEGTFSGCNATVIIGSDNYLLSNKMFKEFAGKVILKDNTQLSSYIFQNSVAEVVWDTDVFTSRYEIPTNSFADFQGSVVFPSGTYTIKSYAFSNASVKSLVFGSGSLITLIETAAFKNFEFSSNGSDPLQSELSLNLSNASIGFKAFEECCADLTFSGVATSMENNAFSNYKGKKLVLPEINSFGNRILYGASAIEEIVFADFPQGTLLGDFFGGISNEYTYHAMQCKDLNNISHKTDNLLPLSLYKVTVNGGTISVGTFSDCVSVTNLTINNGVTVEEGGLYYAIGLNELTIPYLSEFDTKHFAAYLFTDIVESTEYLYSFSDISYNGETVSFTYPKNLTVINLDLSYASDGQEIYIQNSTFTSIPVQEFYILTPDDYGTNSLTEISISLGTDIFKNCSELNTLVIGSTVKSIGIDSDTSNPFPGILYGCWSLVNLTVPFLGPQPLTSSEVNYLNYYNIGYFFGESVSSEIIDGVTVTVINDYNFYIPDSLASVTVNKGRFGANEQSTVTDINNQSFENCLKIKTVTFEGYVNQVKSKVFANTRLEAVHINACDIEFIGNAHFESCLQKNCVLYIDCESLTDAFVGAGSLLSEGNLLWGISVIYSDFDCIQNIDDEGVQTAFESVISDNEYQYKFVNNADSSTQ